LVLSTVLGSDSADDEYLATMLPIDDGANEARSFAGTIAEPADADGEQQTTDAE
jgi:hypothetical protein